MGLHPAKEYLDEHGRHRDDLIKQMSADFVKNPQDLLIEARAELRRQLNYIETLVAECGNQDVPQALLDDVMKPTKVTLPDLVVVDVCINGVSIFSESGPNIQLTATPGDHIVVEMENHFGDIRGTARVVPAPEWEAEERFQEIYQNPTKETANDCT